MLTDLISRKSLAALVGVAAVPGIAVAVAADPPGPPATAPVLPVTAAEVAVEVAPTLGVFKGPRDRADIASGEAAVAAGHIDKPIKGENLGLTRRVDTRGAAGAVHVWPATDAVCYAFEGASGCADISFLEETGLTVATRMGGPNLAPGTIRLGGVARDGISQITVTQVDGSPVDVPVHENVYTVDVSGTPADIVWHDSEGEHRLPVPTG